MKTKIENKLTRADLPKLMLVLIIVQSLDMLTTYISLNLGANESNHVVAMLYNAAPAFVFMYPIAIATGALIIGLIFIRWETELKIAYILLIAQYVFAVSNNIVVMILNM